MKNKFYYSLAIVAFIFFVLTSENIVSAQTLSLQLTPSDYHGYAISCFGQKNGSIDLTVTGGTAPYSYVWSNGAATEDISNLTANYYHVLVTDANNETAEAEITLTEPAPLRVELTAYVYPNGYNISQNSACNGNVQSTVTGGVAPYSYLWRPGLQTTGNPTNLCAREQNLEVTDNNGCNMKQFTVLSEPPIASWTMTGNAGSNPSTQFIGTTDNTDFSLRTNNSEKVKITSSGDLKINNLAGQGQLPVVVDNTGALKAINPNTPCGIGPPYPSWATSTANPNWLLYVCPITSSVGIGTTVANSNPLVKLEVTGKVVIGTGITTPGNYNLYVANGILTEKVKVAVHSSAGWSDFVFNDDYKLKSVKELEDFIKINKHLPEIPTTNEVIENGTDLGEIQAKLLQKIEELTLYIIKQDKRIEVLEQKSKN